MRKRPAEQRSAGLAVNLLGRLDSASCRSFVVEHLKRNAHGTVRIYPANIKAALNAAVRGDLLFFRNPFSTGSLSRLTPREIKRETVREPFSPQEMNTFLFLVGSPWRGMVAVSFLRMDNASAMWLASNGRLSILTWGRFFPGRRRRDGRLPLPWFLFCVRCWSVQIGRRRRTFVPSKLKST